MNIYSNSFFHRVKSFDAIKGILEDGFKAFYCKEEIYMGRGKSPAYIGIPMVSFCDIPLAYFAQNNYGEYGVAMSRSWGREKSLEPVLYYPNDEKCQSTKMIIKAADTFINNRSDYDGYRILGYAKPVKKVICPTGYNPDNYVEREWRKVYANPAPCKWKTESEYNLYRGSKLTPKSPVSLPLTFTAREIDFIIVNKKDVPSLRDFIMNGTLRDIGGKPKAIDLDDQLTLISKILVKEDLLHNM
jgi:hypothetical protein